jgi:hypothetical protein
MRAEVHAGSAVNAFYGLFLLAKGYRANQTGLLAATATDAAVLVKDHTAVLPLLHGARRAGSGAGRILAGAADHHAKITLNAALRLHLDGAVLQGDGARARAAASEHAAKAAYAALGMGHLEAAALPGLGWRDSILFGGLKNRLGPGFFNLFYSLALYHFMIYSLQESHVNNYFAFRLNM